MSNVIQFPARSAIHPPVARVSTDAQVDGKIDPKTTFIIAFNNALIAAAERELIETRWAAANRLGDPESLAQERREAYNRHITAAVRLAETPATTKQHIAMKKRGIGHVWLNAEGEFYAPFRDSVARDEARLRALAA